MIEYQQGTGEQHRLAVVSHALTVAGVSSLAFAFILPVVDIVYLFLDVEHDFAVIVSILVLLLTSVTATVNIRASSDCSNWRSCTLGWNIISGVCHQLAFCAYVLEYAFLNFSDKFSSLCITTKIYAAFLLFLMDCYSLVIVKKYIHRKQRITITNWHSSRYRLLVEHEIGNSINLNRMNNGAAPGHEAEITSGTGTTLPPQYGAFMQTAPPNANDGGPSAPPPPPYVHFNPQNNPH